PIILSDGYKAELTIPTEALISNLKKINIMPMDVSQIEWTTYANNKTIVKGTSPVVAYKFDMGLQTPFYATAKDSLERQLPNLAVDGNPKYPSTWITALSPLPVWIKIDLRSINSIGKIIITARVSGKISYAPKKLTVLVSNDDKIYDEVAIKDSFNDEITEIPLMTTPSARFVKLLIEEGKQGNNIQINEIEFRDPEGTKIVAYTQINSTVLSRTAKLTLYYDEKDLISANIKSEKNLAIFGWNEKLQEWQFVGGKTDMVKNCITVNLNYLSTFAIFESYPQTIAIKWNYNPFSPNGDGIADITTLNINLGQELVSQAKVEIFTYTGRLVRTLIQEGEQSGNISILWDGKDENGDRVEIGPYIYQITIGKKVYNGVLVVAR
ncbi:MAG: discoidin domain-containing protein, partial [Candidatus Poribacteria bacterium]